MKSTATLLIMLFTFFVSHANAQFPINSTFTYQGQLHQGGVAANGQFDLVFRLFDFPVGGSQIGSDATFDDHPINNGSFTVTLSFGDDAFQGQIRWLEIAVDGTTLTPRQTVNPTPYSIYSRDTRGLNVNSDASFVGVGRDTAMSNEEVFGIEAEAASNGYGGMNVKTSQLISRPFYGYYAGDVHMGRHFMDGAAGRWRLENRDGDAVMTAALFNGRFQAAPSDASGFNISVESS